MKTGIHPDYVESKVTCSCGETFMTRATVPELKVEICSKCHPFYSGKQKLVDAGGRVERFQKKYGKQFLAEKKVEVEVKKEANKPLAAQDRAES